VVRSFGQDYIERVRAYQSTSAYQKAVRKRQVWVEPLFAEGKQWHQMRRFRLRRLWRVNTEAYLIAAGQNLNRLLQRRGWGRRPFPSARAAAGGESGFSVAVLCFLPGGVRAPSMPICVSVSTDEHLNTGADTISSANSTFSTGSNVSVTAV